MFLHTQVNFEVNDKKVNEDGTLTHVVTTDVWDQSQFIQLSVCKGKMVLP